MGAKQPASQPAGFSLESKLKLPRAEEEREEKSKCKEMAEDPAGQLRGAQIAAASHLERPLAGGGVSVNYSQPVTFHYEIQSHQSRQQRLSKAFRTHRLAITTMAAIGLAILLGLLLRPRARDWSERQFMYLEMGGKLYLRLLKLILIPLLVSNVILAFGSIHNKLARQLGKVAILLYLASNLLAIVVAISLALLIHPGSPPPTHLRPPTPHPINPDQQAPATITNEQEQHHHHHHHHHFHPHPSEYLNQDHSKPEGEKEEEHHKQHQHHSSDGRSSETGEQHHYMNTYYDPTSSSSSANPSPHSPPLHQVMKPAPPSPLPTLHEFNRIRDPHRGQPPVAVPSAARRPLVSQQTQQSQQVNQSSLISKLDHRLVRSTKLPVDVLLDVLLNLVPDSLIGASLQQTRIRLFAPKELVIHPNGTTDPPPSRWPLGQETLPQANILGLLVVAMMTGVVLGHMQEAGKPMLDLCACVAELSLRLGLWASQFMPICIMFLLVGHLARVHDLSAVSGDLFMYSITVLAALLLHGFLLLPLIYYLVTKKSPFTFLAAMLEALVAAYATSSSAASIALLLNCLGKFKLNHVIVGAFGPLGSVFNMNGTAIYEAIGAIFIAQTLGANLPMTSLILVGLVASMASFSTCGVPSSGLVRMVIVLNAINLPVLQLSLLYIIDFAIDRFRTVVNVWSGAVVCALINQICSRDLFNEELKRRKYHESMRLHHCDTSGNSRLPTFNSNNNNNNNNSRNNSLANLSGGDPPRATAPVEVAAKPKVISITITPPLENSHV